VSAFRNPLLCATRPAEAELIETHSCVSFLFCGSPHNKTPLRTSER
jgi:hypothetical protein